jgi:hypothetical protein
MGEWKILKFLVISNNCSSCAWQIFKMFSCRLRDFVENHKIFLVATQVGSFEKVRLDMWNENPKSNIIHIFIFNIDLRLLICPKYNKQSKLSLM